MGYHYAKPARGRLQVDLLVNNAVAGTYGKFEEIPAERDNQMIQVNVAASPVLV